MKILITGTAGFIGFYLAKTLLEKGHQVVGVDNINDYYDVNLKFARLSESGIDKNEIENLKMVQSKKYQNYRFMKLDISNKDDVFSLFDSERPDCVCNMAAQAGVRFSLTHPNAYIPSNITGFLNILEACRFYTVKQLLYASSSSVYGLNQEQPYTTFQKTDSPISLYAATKKMNELMAHSYSHLYGVPTIGLRFFTVYGPWGRPDMAPFIFTKAIVEQTPINIYNEGKMYRDFTYIDDIIQSIVLLLDKLTEEDDGELYRIYNIGNSNSVYLMDFVETLEKKLNTTAIKNFLPLQQGDMISTLADVSELESKTNFRPNTSIEEGVSKLVDWYLSFKSDSKNH
ncbi:MAG: NAD-dependent epimerase/dehydratase family protein [Bacteroidales bacterium]|nr:NAD-dependent epimerase/dehydratase family protein [Bacteroidales bacterium]